MSRFGLFLELFGKGLFESFRPRGDIRPDAFLSFVGPLVLFAEFLWLTMPSEPGLLEIMAPSIILLLTLQTVRRRLATIGWSDWYFLVLPLSPLNILFVILLGRETEDDMKARNLPESQ